MIHSTKIGCCLLVCLSVIGSLSAYHKFCYTSHNYTGLSQYSEPGTIVHSKKRVEQGRAVHAFTYQYAGSQCVVRISRRDLRRVRNLLSDYDKGVVIDSRFIKKFLETHKRRHAVVGWIMQDFNRVNPTMTVGMMLTTLGL